MRIDIRILDEDFEPIAIIDDFTSLMWNTNFYKDGFFEMYCPELHFEIFEKGRYMARKGSKYTAYITDIGIENYECFATGTFLEKMLEERTILQFEDYTGTVEDVMHALVIKNCISTDGDRVIPRLQDGTNNHFGEKITFNGFGKSVLKALSELAEAYSISFFIERQRTDIGMTTLLFNTFAGVNRTQKQEENEWVQFRKSFDNIVSEKYETNKNYPNVALVYGRGEGSERTSVSVDKRNGEQRREIYVDARDIVKEETMSESAYRNLLIQRGNETLDKNKKVENISCDVDITVKMNFDLGDICTYKYERINRIFELRVTEIRETFESSRIEKKIVFGNQSLGLIEFIQKQAG